MLMVTDGRANGVSQRQASSLRSPPSRSTVLTGSFVSTHLFHIGTNNVSLSAIIIAMMQYQKCVIESINYTTIRRHGVNIVPEKCPIQRI